MATAVGMCSDALVLIGDNPISSLKDEPAASVMYPRAYRALLSCFPWPWAMKEQRLSRNTEEPDELLDFEHSFSLPADHVRTLRVIPNNDYRRIGDKLFSDEEELLIEYVFTAPESKIPFYFEQAMVYKLAFEFSKSVTEDDSASARFYQIAMDAAQEAKTIASQGVPAVEIQDSPFINPYYSTDLYVNRYR